MKVTFLGTSHGVPAADRYCTSVMLEAGGNAYIFDAGAPVADLLTRMGIPFAKVKAFFNSHTHGDHFVGILSFIDLANWYYGDVNARILLPQSNAVQFIRDFSVVTENWELTDRITVEKYSEGEIYDDGTISVRAVPTDHITESDERRSYGFVIEEKATGKRIVFGGDCSAPLNDVAALTEGHSLDLAIFECAHFPYEILEEKLKTMDCRRAAIIHVWGLDKYDLIDASRERISFEILTPNDGDVVDI